MSTEKKTTRKGMDLLRDIASMGIGRQSDGDIIMRVRHFLGVPQDDARQKKSRSGEIVLALLVGVAVFGSGMAVLTKRHHALRAVPGGVGVDLLSLQPHRMAAQDNPGKTFAIIAASIAASVAADKIDIQIGDRISNVGK